jgi:hypothetical protein
MFGASVAVSSVVVSQVCQPLWDISRRPRARHDEISRKREVPRVKRV